MDTAFVDDRLDVLSVSAGVFLVLVGLGTLAGMPWQYDDSVIVMVANVVGTLATIAVGAGLAWLAYDAE